MRVVPLGSGEIPLRRILPWMSASPTRCLVAGPSLGRMNGSSASAKPSEIWVLAVLGESRVSPKAPTAPPFGLHERLATNEVSS